MYGILLFLHLLGGAVWVGGHLVLVTVFLGTAVKGELEPLLRFEARFEKLGIPALVIQIITGLTLAWQAVPSVARWLNPTDPVAHQISTKLFLLILTLALAAHARLVLIPNVNKDNVRSLARHIVLITVVSILFVAAGISVRVGWFR